MKTLLLVYHLLTGGTRQMAEAAARGAQDQPDVHVRLQPAVEAQPADVLAADGYIFATPECLAAMAGLMKDFFDRTYYPVLERITGRPYAILICAGSDGQNAARQIARIATGWQSIGSQTLLGANPRTRDYHGSTLMCSRRAASAYPSGNNPREA